MRCALLLFLCLITLLVASAFPPQSVASVRINEVLPAPRSDWDGDLDPDSKRDEWVEIVNCGASTYDVSACLLLSGDDRSVVYGFSGSLPPDEVFIVFGTDAVTWEGDNGHSAIGLSLNNGGDIVLLAEVSGGDTLVVDSLRYTSAQVGYDVSVGRFPDGSGPWTLFDHLGPMGGVELDPTPGLSNASDPAPHVLVVTRDPLFPTSSDSTRMIVEAGDASGIVEVLLAYVINLEDGEEPAMTLAAGTSGLGTWTYTILPCAAGDTVHYRVTVSDPQSSAVTPWIGYRVRSAGLQVRMNEVLADPPADLPGDTNRDGERDASDDEFIEIVNCGTIAVDMAGWRLSDAVSLRHEFPDTGIVVLPGEFVTVFGGGTPTGFGGKVFTASSGALGLTNSGDIVSLFDGAGSLVDVLSYGGEGGGDEAMIRFPDCSDTWAVPSDVGLEEAFSPHSPNDASSSSVPATWGNIKALFR
jgi:hypothetical protein